jgi:hypothetical protein
MKLNVVTHFNGIYQKPLLAIFQLYWGGQVRKLEYYIDNILSLNNSKLSDFLDPIYPIELKEGYHR